MRCLKILCLAAVLISSFPAYGQIATGMPARFCPECGLSNEAQSRFCGRCGTMLPPPAAPAETVQAGQDRIQKPVSMVWSEIETEESAESVAKALKCFQYGEFDNAMMEFGKVKQLFPRSRYIPYCDYLSGVSRDIQKMDEKNMDVWIVELMEKRKSGTFGGGWLTGFVSFPLLILLLVSANR
jgi:hypothetical protein